VVRSDNAREGRPPRRPFRRAPKLVAVLLGLASTLAATYAVAAVITAPGKPAPQASTASVRSLGLRARPASITVNAGETARYILRGKGRARTTLRRIRLSASGLPPGARASFRFFGKRIAQRSVVILTVTTSRGTPPGAYPLRLAARKHRLRRAIYVRLVVAGSPVQPGPAGPVLTAPGAFRIDGDLTTELMPGSGEPLDLRLTNPGSADLSISRLDVRVDAVTAPRANSTHPCTSGDFIVQQFSGPYGFIVPASDEVSLSGLGIPSSQWPSVGMLNSSSNQDGCMSARLVLGFAGSGT
jgi:hypothetical protein